MCLMLFTLMVHAAVQMQAYSPPEQDAGCLQAATLSLDGTAVVSFDSQLNIVELQTPVMPDTEAGSSSAQVADAYSLLTPIGEISMTLAYLRWPTNGNEMMNPDENYSLTAGTTTLYSFVYQRTDFI